MGMNMGSINFTDQDFWIRVLSARSLCSTVEFKSKALGGNPPNSSKLETPLTVAIWLYISCRLVVRFASRGILCPSLSLTCIVVTYLFLSGSKRKFSCALFFLLNLLAGFVGSDKEVPVPEKAM